MFVWLFHRISGLALFVLLGMQMVTGLLQLVKSKPDVAEAARAVHMNGFVVGGLVFLIIMHAMYGLRTVLYDMGIRKERMLFWVCTVSGVALSLIYVSVFLSVKLG